MVKNQENTRQSPCAPSLRSTNKRVSRLEAALIFWPVAIFGAFLDIWSKYAVFNWLRRTEEYRFSIIDGFLQLIMRENTGAAFSVFRGWTTFLIVISCIALVVVIGLFFSRKITSKWALFALGCITAGIIGNLYDRLFNDGRVRDFIDVYIGIWDTHWPTFNIADSLLCIGVGLMIILNLKSSADAE